MRRKEKEKRKAIYKEQREHVRWETQQWRKSQENCESRPQGVWS